MRGNGADGGLVVVEKRRRSEETVLHEVVRRGWPELLAHMTLPPRVHAEVRRYLGCGQLGKGFVHVQCTACKESRLVAFSCALDVLLGG